MVTYFAQRPLARAGLISALLALLLLPAAAQVGEPVRVDVEDYQIEVELIPRRHRLEAIAKVKFTALEELPVAVFGLHNGLRVTRVLDADGKPLSSERMSSDSTVRVPLPNGLAKGASTTLTFEYEGVLQSAVDSPVRGLQLAYVGEDTSYLLYPGRWFPMVGYGTDRFTSTISVTVPAGMKVIGSGEGRSAPAKPAIVKKGEPPDTTSRVTHTFSWTIPSFPGTVIAGYFEEHTLSRGVDYKVYFKPANSALAPVHAETIAKEFEYFSTLYGPAGVVAVKLVELPNDTVPAAWAPEIAAISSNAISEKTNYRLLANVVSHQWWGVRISPASKQDFWLSDGFARFSEARYVEQAAGQAGFEEVMKDLSVGALAYDTVPLSGVGRLDEFSPEFQSLVTDKGAVILNMLRWVMGDQNFDQAVRNFVGQFNGKSAATEDFQKLAEQVHNERLGGFFSQWFDSTGAPQFRNKYTIYRVQNGFRVVGEIAQDLDLFRMPVELRVDTDGQSEMKRIEVVGTKSPYVIETFGKPRRIVIDPGQRVLTSSPDLQVRVAILRGQQLVVQGDLAEALREFNKALEVNKNSSLAHYRIAEVFFLQRNYQAAANEYRESIAGDREPPWTEVWSYLQLGKIFDLTNQRERAVAEYRKALQTNDNTAGAQEEARKYLQAPYERERERQSGGD